MDVSTIYDLTVNKNISLSDNSYIKGTMASNDYWRLLGNGSNGNGYFEIATADEGTEPIYVRQYTGAFSTLERTLTLLDNDGNTVLPGVLNVQRLRSTETYIDFDSPVIFNSPTTWIGDSSSTEERKIRFSSNDSNGTYKHDAYLYGGNADSTTAFGFYDDINKRRILFYNDSTNTLMIGGHLNFLDWSGQIRKPVASITADTHRTACIGTYTSNIMIIGQWSDTSFSARNIAATSSDIRIKKNIGLSEVKSALDTINQITMHSFDWTDGNGHQKIGFIADELEALDDRLSLGGGFNDDGTINIKSVNDFYLLGYVVKAIQELYQMIGEIK